jgi:hypothetical protein
MKRGGIMRKVAAMSNHLPEETRFCFSPLSIFGVSARHPALSSF